jgi:hypothetical protein
LHKIQQLTLELRARIEAANHEIEYIVTVGPENEEYKSITEKETNFDATTDGLNRESTFDKPMSLRVCMFQLSESNNLDRITNVLQNL